MNHTVGTVVKPPKLPPEDYNEQNDVTRTLAERLREIRLYSLKTDPDAFASSYEVEVEQDLGFTLNRLKTPLANHFFAVDRPVRPWTKETHEEFFKKFLDADLLGMMVLIERLGGEEVTARKNPLSPVKNQESSKENDQSFSQKPLHYAINGTFVDPKARGLGLGKRLMEAALAYGQQDAFARRRDFRCTVLVDSENDKARKLYERAGFSATGQETYVQYPRMEMGETKAEERVAIQLELRRSLSDGSSSSKTL